MVGPDAFAEASTQQLPWSGGLCATAKSRWVSGKHPGWRGRQLPPHADLGAALLDLKLDERRPTLRVAKAIPARRTVCRPGRRERNKRSLVYQSQCGLTTDIGLWISIGSQPDLDPQTMWSALFSGT